MRSIIKGPYVEYGLIKKIQKLKQKNENIKDVVIKTKSRRSTIVEEFVGYTFDVYNGKRYSKLEISVYMVGFKLGDFVFTKTTPTHAGVKNTKMKSKKTTRKK